MKKSLYILTALLLAACMPNLPDSPENLVIEGWIENDASPMVFVTSTISATFQEQDITDIIAHVATTATVSITYQGQKYPLTPVINDDYLLRVCYTNHILKGTIGGTYQLDVDWKGMHAEAITSIPSPGCVDSITVERHPHDNKLYIIKAHIQPAPESRYYRFFSMTVGKDSTYGVSYTAPFDSKFHADEMIAISRSSQNPIMNSGYYHNLNDSVRFKLASMDASAYDFWNKFKENNVFSHAAIIPYSSNLKGNITGGLGYFFGYGISSYGIRIE